MVKQIKNTTKYFISDEGFCFRIINNKEVIIPIEIINRIPKVKIENNKFNMILLMIEYFGKLEKPIFKTSFKIVDGKLPLSNINIKYPNNNELDSVNIFRYKCAEKAKYHNSRVNYKNIITSEEVLDCLKRTDFKCFYCNEKIKTKTWHLEHLVPISKGGLNDYKNIAASCKECNLMKGAIDMKTFIKKCYKIIKHDSLMKGIVLKKSKLKN